MNVHAPTQELRDWIRGRLDPLEERDAPEGSSDFDLNPGLRALAKTPLTPASVLVALVEREAGFSVILTKRSENLRQHTGQVALPGGRRDPGETAWDTALREAHEEIGLDPAFVSLAGLASPHQTGTGYLITPVVGFVREGFSLMPNEGEVAEIFETPFRFLMDPANHQEGVREAADGHTRRFYSITHEDRVIWGATAAILRALYYRLAGAALV